MPTKTISLELDAYEKLRCQKRPGESFSAVVRRARFEHDGLTGRELLEHAQRAVDAAPEAFERAIAYWDRAEREERHTPRVTPSKWEQPPQE